MSINIMSLEEFKWKFRIPKNFDEVYMINVNIKNGVEIEEYSEKVFLISYIKNETNWVKTAYRVNGLRVKEEPQTISKEKLIEELRNINSTRRDGNFEFLYSSGTNEVWKIS